MGHWLAQPLSSENLWHLITELVATYFRLMGPVFVVAVLIGIGANMAQVGLKVSPEFINQSIASQSYSRVEKDVFPQGPGGTGQILT